MRVLITGAAGFVGTAVVSVLGRTHWLRCVDIGPMLPPRVGETLVADLASYESAVSSVELVDAIVHLAIGRQAVDDENPESPLKGTVVGTVNLLEAARKAGVQRFVLMSSGAVVSGYSRNTFITGDMPHCFRGLYPLTKSLQETAARQYAEEFGLTIPALRPWLVVDGRTYQRRTGDPLGWDGGYFGLVCRYDLAEACRLALAAPLEGFQPFHVMATAPGRRGFDVERTERLLGWHPLVDFGDLATGGETNEET